MEYVSGECAKDVPHDKFAMSYGGSLDDGRSATQQQQNTLYTKKMNHSSDANISARKRETDWSTRGCVLWGGGLLHSV